jgi:GNAT superfamily N-acetyltransferase
VTLTLTTYRGPDTLHASGDIIDLYRAVFTAPPWNETDARIDEFSARLARDVQRPGFVAKVAHLDGHPAGFGTGWPTRSPFPSTRAYGRVVEQLGSESVAALLIGALEVDELAVAPAAQRHGVGGRILDALLKEAPDQRAWLLTWNSSPQATGFYRRRGWRQANEPTADERQVVVFLSPSQIEASRPG